VATSEPVVLHHGLRVAVMVATRRGRLLQRLFWAALRALPSGRLYHLGSAAMRVLYVSVGGRRESVDASN
jgi:hypothetical protein